MEKPVDIHEVLCSEALMQEVAGRGTRAGLSIDLEADGYVYCSMSGRWDRWHPAGEEGALTDRITPHSNWKGVGG